MNVVEKTAMLPIFIFLLIILGSVGWTMNIVWFCNLDFEKPYKAEIIRGVGIAAAPVGAVVGYIPIEDGEVKKQINKQVEEQIVEKK